MFSNLQKKWHVNAAQVLLILCTFTLGGSITGYAGRKIMYFIPINSGVLWVIVYIILVSLLWPLAVLLVSYPLGQYNFFKHYIYKIGVRLGIMKTKKINLAVFASGGGSNAEKIFEYFKNHSRIKVSLLICNKQHAGVLAIAKQFNIPVQIIERGLFLQGDAYLPILKEKNIQFIALAGFLWKMPPALIKAYPGKIVNIHPALLPKYGGKGFYGHHVHEAVIAHGEAESGITIHYVDEVYDHGETIFQATCPVMPGDTAQTLATRVLELEHTHFSQILEKTILTNT